MNEEPKLTPKLFADIGEAIHGPHWQVPLAKGMKVNERTMRRWAKDGFPLRLAAELRFLLFTHEKEVARVTIALADAIAKDTLNRINHKRI